MDDLQKETEEMLAEIVASSILYKDLVHRLENSLLVRTHLFTDENRAQLEEYDLHLQEALHKAMRLLAKINQSKGEENGN